MKKKETKKDKLTDQSITCLYALILNNTRISELRTKLGNIARMSRYLFGIKVNCEVIKEQLYSWTILVA